MTLRIGTRASALALWQARHVRDRLAAAGVTAELVPITTTGDGIQDRPFAAIGDTALFTRQLDEALLEGRIDLAVHSLKDLPSRLRAGLTLAAVGQREDPRDALVTRGPGGWDSVPEHAVIATCSVRRRAQLLWHRPDLRVEDIRGNVDTRLARLATTTHWHGTLLAAAGLVRLGWADRISERLDPTVLLPAPGQGALGLTTRDGDEPTIRLLQTTVDHAETAAAVTAERALLRDLDGGCQVPIAALGIIADGQLTLRARVLADDGSVCLEAAEAGDPTTAEALGLRAAARLRERGAAAILANSRRPVEARP